MTSVNGVNMSKKGDERSEIENGKYEINLKTDSRALGKLRSGVAFGQLSHPTI